MKDYQERIVSEFTDLSVKLKKLDDFLDSESFKGIDEKEKFYLRLQHKAMSMYLDILNSRIENFNRMVNDDLVSAALEKWL